MRRAKAKEVPWKIQLKVFLQKSVGRVGRVGQKNWGAGPNGVKLSNKSPIRSFLAPRDSAEAATPLSRRRMAEAGGEGAARHRGVACPPRRTGNGRATPTQLKLLRAKTHGRPAPTSPQAHFHRIRVSRRFMNDCSENGKIGGLYTICSIPRTTNHNHFHRFG